MYVDIYGGTGKGTPLHASCDIIGLDHPLSFNIGRIRFPNNPIFGLRFNFSGEICFGLRLIYLFILRH